MEGSQNLPHVLLIVDQMPKALGGGERVALRIAEELPAYGYRASILTFGAALESAALQSPPCPVYLLPLTRTYDLQALRAARELRRFIARERVCLVQTFFESSDLWGGLVAKSAGAKLIWSRRDMGILRGRKHEIAYRGMSALPDAVFAVSEQVRRHCIEVDRVKPARVHTVYNGLDLARWSAMAKRSPGKEGGVLVTTVGNIRRVKGHDLLVRAAAKVRQQAPHVRFSIAGAVLEPDYFEELKHLVAALQLDGCFTFAGPVNDLQAHFATAGIFVLPSRSEGFSNAIIEAMAASLPVVATDAGGNAEAVDNGVSGLIVPAENVDALADALLGLLADPERAAAMGTMGREIVERRFTVRAMMTQMTAVYARLLRVPRLRD